MRRVLALLSALAVTTGGCSPTKPDHSSGSVSGTVYSLLADNRLVAQSLTTGRALNWVRLGTTPEGGRSVEHVMALATKRDQLVVLVSQGKPGASSIAFVDIPALRVRATRPVPVPDVTYRGLALGAQSGRIYLFGNRIVGTDAGPAHGPPSDAVVTVLNPTATQIVVNWTVHPASGRNWYVLRGAVAPDERQLFVSYHGSDTQGMDTFSLASSGFDKCSSSPDPASGCIRIHGDFELYHGGFLAATGSPDILEMSRSGTVRRVFNTGLQNNHLMEFAVDATRALLYAVGSCGYVPGLSVVDLATGHDHLLVPLGGRICGERVVLGPDSLLVILQLPTPVAGTSTPGALLYVDSRTGKLQQRVATPSSPIDAVVVSV